MWRRILFSMLTAVCALPCFSYSIQDSLCHYVAGKDARIGVAVVTDDGRTFGINETEQFPMMSVMKFPLSLAVAEYVKANDMTFDSRVAVDKSYLHTDTHSPMLMRYHSTENHSIPIGELVDYAMRVSDNNACDILMDFIGGAQAVEKYLKMLDITEISVKYNENEMNSTVELCRDNYTSPEAMVRLIDLFDHGFNDPYSRFIKGIMESCETGTDRLAKTLIPLNALIGHKTGTGPTDKATGRLMALNDVGYVCLPDGIRYSIAVFIADSTYPINDTAKIISDIGEIVWKGLSQSATPDKTR